MTSYEELPLMYKHPKEEGMLIMAPNVNSQGREVRGEFIWAIQKDRQTLESGIVKGLKRLDKVRNEFIAAGWQRYNMPNIKVRKPGEVKEPEKVIYTEDEIKNIESSIMNSLNDADRTARTKAITDIQNISTPFSKWLLEE